MVGGSTCDGARRLFDLWRHYLKPPFFQVLTVPRKSHERAHELYYLQVEEFKKNLEQFMGIAITDDDLLKAIALMNESRSLLKELYTLRALDEPLISGQENQEVLNGSFRMPKICLMKRSRADCRPEKIRFGYKPKPFNSVAAS